MATAVATTNGREPKGLPALLNAEAAQARIAPFLPEGVSYERVVAAAQLAAMHNPDIAKCTPASIVGAVAKAMQAGLEIGVTAHLVPFGQTLTFVADYKGLAQLMIASRAVRHVEARCVYQADAFDYEQGLEPTLRHIPCTDAKQRGALVGAYVILHLPFGHKVFDYMPIEDIDAIRKKHSKQWKQGECPAWYAKKTVVRQVAKLVPKDPRLAKALAVMEQDEREEFGEIPATARMLDDEDDVPRTARALRPGTDASDPVNRDQRSRSIRQAEYGGGEEARVEVGSLAIDEAGGEEYQNDSDLADELPLGDARRGSTRIAD